MLRRALTAAVALAGVLAPAAHADAGGSGVGAPGCKGASPYVKVCAEETISKPGSGGSSGTTAKPAGTSGEGGSESPCTYTELNPQPPADNLAWEGKTAKDGALYQVNCSDTGRIGVVFVANGGGPAAPTIDPELVARRAVDSMKLVGPDVASPKAGGRYVVGMPMWMWAEQGPTTFGPASASATAGGVTVTATAKVSSIEWAMGDGTTITCRGPGTRYDASQGKRPSPDCGHRYNTASTGQTGGKYAGTATATWTVEWQAAAFGDAGEFTETRATPFTADVREVQVLN
ncbi:ATP/GTP-binding protein [Streptomyces sp. NPDC046324]|uniref:ATP/GTP-binding protein n=1 Tax=Streptomyces sp. NPDC046324 TaxID=3154915 RepID=UPI0033DE1416